jgi:hypothetical protein
MKPVSASRPSIAVKHSVTAFSLILTESARAQAHRVIIVIDSDTKPVFNAGHVLFIHLAGIDDEKNHNIVKAIHAGQAKDSIQKPIGKPRLYLN